MFPQEVATLRFVFEVPVVFPTVRDDWCDAWLSTFPVNVTVPLFGVTSLTSLNKRTSFAKLWLPEVVVMVNKEPVLDKVHSSSIEKEAAVMSLVNKHGFSKTSAPEQVIGESPVDL